MEEFLEDIGLERYAPRFAENDVHAIEDLPTKPSKLETVLDIVGITGNPGHLKKFRLRSRMRGQRRRRVRQTREG